MNHITDDKIRRYLNHFENFERQLNGGSKFPIHSRRLGAIRHFAESGFPTTRDEEWRFTNVTSLRDVDWSISPTMFDDARLPGLVETHKIGDSEFIRLTFVNGRFSSAYSTPSTAIPGVFAGSLRSALESGDPRLSATLGTLADLKGNPFTALNTAFIDDGACIHVDEGRALDRTIQLLFLTLSDGTPIVVHPRILIVAGKRSKVSIVETYAGLGAAPYFSNVVTEMLVGEEAVVEHDKLQVESPGAYHIGASFYRLAEKSSMTSNSLSFGGTLVRNNVSAYLGGEFCECTLNGLSLATGTQLIDNHTAIDHATPNCSSHELYKSILDGKSRGVFNGKIFVRKDAQKTDAKQTNKTLILSDDARIDTKPQLEIFADDVKCTHGATVGQLDEDQVFYLRARGIDLDEARDILTFAFARDIVSRIHVEQLRGHLEQMVHARLHHGRVAGN